MLESSSDSITSIPFVHGLVRRNAEDCPFFMHSQVAILLVPSEGKERYRPGRLGKHTLKLHPLLKNYSSIPSINWMKVHITSKYWKNSQLSCMIRIQKRVK